MRCLRRRADAAVRALPVAWSGRAGPNVQTDQSDDEGSVTIEAAFGIASLVIVTGFVLGALAAAAVYIAAVDAAGAAARAHALGTEFTPARGEVHYAVSDGWVTATVSMPTPLLAVTASAVYPEEPGNATR